MFCTQCASFNDNNASFCHSCGGAISRPSDFSPTISPMPVSPVIQRKPTPPWYIRWFFIIPVLFFWPSFFLPIGPMAALGFTLIRLRNIPSSSVKFGWLLSFVSLLWTCVYAKLFWWLKSNGWGASVLYPLGFFLICSMACFLYGTFLAVRGRKPSQFARLLENNQVQTVEQLAHALGASDTAKTKQEFKRAIKQGWLNGYDLNEATGEIHVSPFPRDVFQVCRRSLVGSGFVVLSLCMLVRFGVGNITDTISPGKSSQSTTSRSQTSPEFDVWKELYNMSKYAMRERDDKWHRVSNAQAWEKKNFTETVNGIQLEMKAVHAGSFTMGSPDNEAGHDKSESPQRRVSVSAFAIGKYEVTQAQWRAVMNSNPSKFKGDDLPVEMVSWNDAKRFCLKLSQITDKAYRLPTEAEWEYAARAGTMRAYAGELDALAWYVNNSDGKTHSVGQKKANVFGLHDMHGNVWEWCEDVWHNNYNGAPPDGSAWLVWGDQGLRVLRGGSWFGDGFDVRSANRVLSAKKRRGEKSAIRDQNRDKKKMGMVRMALRSWL